MSPAAACLSNKKSPDSVGAKCVSQESKPGTV